MKGTALWKLERRVDLSINTRPRGVVGERPWTDEILPYTSNVWPWGVQRLSIQHEASGEP